MAHRKASSAPDLRPDGGDASAIGRRDFLKASAILTGGLWMFGFVPPPDYQFKILTADDVAVMDALADCIIPPDEFWGGKEAGVTRFIDHQLGRYLHRSKDMYRACLPALNDGTRAHYGRPFVELEEDDQVGFLTEVDAGRFDQDSWGGYAPSAFFNTMCDHSMMAYYGHPRHGGNKQWISYAMLELPVYMHR